jgi:nucleotide-binding universal stress UspA family protein
MLQWRKICCPVDFSETSFGAMQAAADLAQRFGAELTLLFVYEMPRPVPQEMLFSPPELFQKMLRDVDHKLAGWKARAEQSCASPVKALRLLGPPVHEILRCAREERFDLLVLGTHGRTGIQHAVFGSVAEKVLRQAPCPVLTIRPTPEQLGHPLPPHAP